MPCSVDLQFDRFCDYSLVSTTNVCFGFFELNQSGTFGGSNILEPGSNILEPQNFIFNILEGNEEKKL